ncbi:MAG: AglZ/HisF2 family acetamidino modification protein, partial [Planctomycetota bacterium]
MLRPRIIPCLLVKDKGLVKTVNFKNPKYVGDPINAVRIFNEKEVDELMVLDIDATGENRGPDYKMIEHLAAECRMPLCYGGGVKTVEQSQRIFGLGVEKVAISSAAVENPELVTRLAEQVGNQSIVVVLDVKKRLKGGKYEVWTHNGLKNTAKCPVAFAQQLERLGVGEIVVNSIDNDGMMKGYDLALVDKIRESISVPLTVLGG